MDTLVGNFYFTESETIRWHCKLGDYDKEYKPIVEKVVVV